MVYLSDYSIMSIVYVRMMSVSYQLPFKIQKAYVRLSFRQKLILI